MRNISDRKWTPLKIVDDKGFCINLDQLLTGLGNKLTISAENMSTKIKTVATRIRQKLTMEMKNRLICLKIDCAKRLSRSILGINVKFIEGEKLKLRTLASQELTDRQRA